jgi:hypothetical protein
MASLRPVSIEFYQSFMGINYADVTPYLSREMIRVSWEQREFHRDETLLYCFQNLDVSETVT